MSLRTARVKLDGDLLQPRGLGVGDLVTILVACAVVQR